MKRVWRDDQSYQDILYLGSFNCHQPTLQVLGLDVCADTLVGSQIIRGISGGQRKRVTTGKSISISNYIKTILILSKTIQILMANIIKL